MNNIKIIVFIILAAVLTALLELNLPSALFMLLGLVLSTYRDELNSDL